MKNKRGFHPKLLLLQNLGRFSWVKLVLENKFVESKPRKQV